MRRQAVALGMGALLWGSPVAADETILQTRVNVTIAVPSFGQATNELRQVSEAFDARLENLNMDSASGSGNVNFKVPGDQVAEVMASLEKVGRIQNQSQSTSDYTSSVLQYERKAKAFRALANLDSGALFAKLPADQRTEVITEFQSFLNSGLQNNESSASNYRQMGRFVDISVSLTSQPVAPATPVGESGETTDAAPAAQAAPATMDTRPLYLFCLLNFLGLWAIYRRVDRPDPLLPQSPHTH